MRTFARYFFRIFLALLSICGFLFGLHNINMPCAASAADYPYTPIAPVGTDENMDAEKVCKFPNTFFRAADDKSYDTVHDDNWWNKVILVKWDVNNYIPVYSSGNLISPFSYIDCVNTGLPEEYNAGSQWSWQNRYHNNGDGTIIDNLTGLMWMQDLRDLAKEWMTLSYSDNLGSNMALSQLFEKLKSGSYPKADVGYHDWRYPNINEKTSLSSKPDDLLNNKTLLQIGFIYEKDNSSMFVRGTSNLPKTGVTTSKYSGDDGYFRAGFDLPVPRYTEVTGDDGNKCVLDNLTGLVWSTAYIQMLDSSKIKDNANLSGYSASFLFAHELTYPFNAVGPCGYHDWRLANFQEVNSIIDHASTADAQGPILPLPNRSLVQNKYFVRGGSLPKSADISVSLQSDKSEVILKPGDNITYTATVSNNSGNTVGVVYVDALPQGVTSVTPGQGNWLKTCLYYYYDINWEYVEGDCFPSAFIPGGVASCEVKNMNNYLIRDIDGYDRDYFPGNGNTISFYFSSHFKILDMTSDYMVVCKLGKMKSGDSKTISYTVATDKTATKLSHKAVVYSNGADPTPDNNVSASTLYTSKGGYYLKVGKGGTGKGIVTSGDGEINCDLTGTSTSSCAAIMEKGTTVTLSATASDGYAFTGWKGACTGTGACTISMTGAKNVWARFGNIQTCYVTAKVSGKGGTITPAGETTALTGETKTYTVTPNAGYEITDVRVGGKSVKSQLVDNSYIHTVTGSATITATFKPIKYTVSIATTANELDGKPKAYNVNGGTSPAYTLTTNGNKVIYSLTIDGVDTALANSESDTVKVQLLSATKVKVTFKSIVSNHTIAVAFASKTGKKKISA